jgi:predicted amidohydrolase YtcJ
MVIIITMMFAGACTKARQKADLILINGKIYLVDDAFGNAEAFAVKDGKFLAIGTNKEVLDKYESDYVLDVSELTVYPGFIDGHCHFYGYGENLIRYANLTGSRSMEEVVERLRQHAKKYPSDWILGRGWDQNLFPDKTFPDNTLLEQHFPGRKILLIRIDGHASLASKAAILAAGIDKNSSFEGGQVLLNHFSEPTGILIDKADNPVRALIPGLTTDEKIQALLEAQENCFAVGLTSVHDAGLPAETIELIDSIQRDGKLKMRINAMLNPDELTLAKYLPQGRRVGENLSITAVKMYADGALGSRGARLIEPYSDEPGSTGLFLYNPKFYQEIAKRVYDAGFQLNMHAIGDAAVRYVLQLYSSYLQGPNDRRWRIEHAQVVHPDDFGLFKSYSIIPSIQSTHATSDMYWAIDRLGNERIKYAYAQKFLLEQNGWLVNGTDFPIEDINPLNTFYAAVFRTNHEGWPEDGFQPENALSRIEALRSMTIWAAKGGFEEQLKGSIEIGKLADFVVLDTDLMTAEADAILKAKPKYVFLNGKQVFGD